MEEIKVFLDSNVLISAILSQKGASYNLIYETKFKKIISKTIVEEIMEVSKRENINLDAARTILKMTIKTTLSLSKESLLKAYSKYVLDEEDSHVVAGTYISKSDFLLTHNIRHYRVAEIRNYLEIEVMRPGDFLQYLRSR